jgi:hypothetical protein
MKYYRGRLIVLLQAHVNENRAAYIVIVTLLFNHIFQGNYVVLLVPIYLLLPSLYISLTFLPASSKSSKGLLFTLLFLLFLLLLLSTRGEIYHMYILIYTLSLVKPEI